MMHGANGPMLARLLCGVMTEEQASSLIDLVEIDPAILSSASDLVSRGVLAQAVNLVLLKDLLDRVPHAALYVEDLRRERRRLVFDHGALRTVDLIGMGDLPAGEAALTRVLLPLGYRRNEVYPLDRLAMTGRSYTHADFPETLPQFFVSELHIDRFSPAFRAAARRVTASSVDCLDNEDRSRLDQLDNDRALRFTDAAKLLPQIVGCFSRRHAEPQLSDYELLLAESAEMAWVATEGNVFNHATDRVPAIEALADRQRALGRPMKEVIEVSANGRIRQTAYQADPILRRFVATDGMTIERLTPGSFFEFIQRAHIPGGSRLDLSFDSSNAQGIFTMTGAKVS